MLTECEFSIENNSQIFNNKVWFLRFFAIPNKILSC
ncbi:hypothetical protein TcasGA2_TC031882 [Tribolium castaneum]|uniref:Uncharacterized protein n=1 Tax=Tribolium castaneum TaxID=7070 RepID=A0A139WA42_TRICA|nr:hypothetical protein TcasGA2_TC031882 [Tribolium castaneum]